MDYIKKANLNFYVKNFKYFCLTKPLMLIDTKARLAKVWL